MEKNIVGVTGHRTLVHDVSIIAAKFLESVENLKATHVITGMAVGYDQLVAEVCLEFNIPFIAAVPFAGQEKRWPKHVQERYSELLAKAHIVQIVSEGAYAGWKMHVRNEWIVNNSTAILAYFDGRYVEGSGTAACCKYTIKKQKPLINLYAQISV